MSDFVYLSISSTKSQYGSEKRFARDLLISELKVRRYSGISHCL